MPTHQKRELCIDFRNESEFKEQFELAENVGDRFPWYSWWILSRAAGPASPNAPVETEPSTTVRRDGGNQEADRSSQPPLEDDDAVTGHQRNLPFDPVRHK